MRSKTAVIRPVVVEIVREVSGRNFLRWESKRLVVWRVYVVGGDKWGCMGIVGGFFIVKENS